MSEIEIKRLNHLKNGIRGLPFKEKIGDEVYVPANRVVDLINATIRAVRKEHSHKNKS